jgi:hypothetical protein
MTMAGSSGNACSTFAEMKARPIAKIGGEAIESIERSSKDVVDIRRGAISSRELRRHLK